MEQRVVFGSEPSAEGTLVTDLRFEPSRSPFIRQRLSITHEAETLDELVRQVEGLSAEGQTFKVRFVKTELPVDYKEQRQIEGKVGAVIRGQVDVRNPELLYGVAQAGGRWYFGRHLPSTAVWLAHQNKPQGYSTALNTRVARAIVNIALPDPETAGRRLIDPCCGIGTVLVEALSMGIEAIGSDMNPLAVKGARVNLAHYGYPNVVRIKDIGEVEGSYNAAVVDLPYNLCSVSPPEEQLRILSNAKRLAPRVVLVTTENIDELIREAGFRIVDRCEIPKGKLVRQVILCE